MALWPFRKRRKRSSSVTEGKKAAPVLPELAFQRKPSLSRNPSKKKRRSPLFLSRNASRRGASKDRETSYASSTGPVPEFPLPPNQPGIPTPTGQHFQPQKQQHESGFSSYFQEHNHSATMTASSGSSLPHKKSSIVRKLSQRRDTRAQHPPASHVARQISKGKRPMGRERSISAVSTAPRHSLQSSFSEASSGRAYKIRNIDVFSPHPTLRYEESSSPTSMRSRHMHAGLVPSRTNSRRSNKSRMSAHAEWRYKGVAISEEHYLGDNRVDYLADELDARGLREVMERDSKRRERKRLEDEEKLRRKLERRASKQQQMEQGKQTAGGEPGHAEQEPQDYDMQDAERGENSASAPDARIGYAISGPYPAADNANNARPTSTRMGTQTPLSWLDINPSSEEINKGAPTFPRPDVVTPVSMNSQEDRPADENVSTPYDNSQEPLPNAGVGIAVSSPQQEEELKRTKPSLWGAFLRKATQGRIKKEEEKSQTSRAIQAGHSSLISDSEGEEGKENRHVSHPNYVDIDRLRHREGQTPGKHVPKEISFAMTALETGRLQEKEYADEMRDSVPARAGAPYQHIESPSSSKSSLAHHNLSPRPQHSTATLTPQNVDTVDSPAAAPARTSSQQSRPISMQRYTPSPSMHRYSSGAASPETGPRSIMSTSLASIDSEGSWLSGKMTNPRKSVQPVSPLRASASSLRKRYQEVEDESSMMEEDDYFSGVDRPLKESSSDAEAGGARLDLSDDSDSGDEGSVTSEVERNMWQEGLAKKPEVVHMHARAQSREGMLDDFGNFDNERERRPSNASTAKAPRDSTFTEGPYFESPGATPIERYPFGRTDTAGSEHQNEFQTPLEHPSTIQMNRI